MGNTIYASFADPLLAEKAAGALLDHGVRPEDISVVRNQDVGTDSIYGATNVTTEYGSAAVPRDNLEASDTPGPGGRAWDDAVERNRAVSEGTPTLGSDAVSTPGAYGATGAASSGINDDASLDTYDLDTANRGYGDTAYRAANVDEEDIGPEGDVEVSAKQGISTTTPGDAGAGAVKGAGWGLGIGAVAALASLIVPGVGLVLGGGALAAALGGVAASAGAGAVAGAVTGYLKDQGVDDRVAEDYDRTITSGGALLAVTLPSGGVSEGEAHSVLDKYGAMNVNSYATRGPGGYVA